MMAACGEKRRQQIATPSPAFISQSTSPVDEPTQPVSPLDATPEINSPTVAPSIDTPSFPGITDFHYPPAQFVNRQRPHKIGLIAAMEDPFFITLVHGARQAAVNLDVELFANLPQNWSSAEQIQLFDALLARGDLDALLLSPADPQALIPSLQKAADAGILILTLQTSLADNSGVTPLFTMNTDNHLGGFLACQALVQSLTASEVENEKTPTPPKRVYIQKGKPGILDPDAREQGCQEALAQGEDIQLAGIDNHEDDPLKASQQVRSIMANEPELSAIVCTDMICTQAASQALASQGLNGEIKIVAFDATPAAVELLRQGSIDILVTPKPFDMGYLTVAIATAALDGVTSLPPSLTTGWEILTRPDLDNPSAARWFYDN